MLNPSYAVTAAGCNQRSSSRMGGSGVGITLGSKVTSIADPGSSRVLIFWHQSVHKLLLLLDGGGASCQLSAVGSGCDGLVKRHLRDAHLLVIHFLFLVLQTAGMSRARRRTDCIVGRLQNVRSRRSSTG